MRDDNFLEAVSKIVEKDPRYSVEAYDFVRNGVNYTAVKLERHKNKDSKHVSGQELLQGIADYASEQFGPFAKDVLLNWGIVDGISIGNIVFNMVNEKLLTANEKDSIEDFAIDFSFEKVLLERFRNMEQKKINPPTIA